MNDAVLKVVDDNDAPKSFITKAEVKRRIKQLEHNTASDFCDALNAAVSDMVDKAVERAKENKRKLVRPCDL